MLSSRLLMNETCPKQPAKSPRRGNSPKAARTSRRQNTQLPRAPLGQTVRAGKESSGQHRPLQAWRKQNVPESLSTHRTAKPGERRPGGMLREGTIASAPGAGVAEAVLASDRSWILRVQGRRKEPRTGQPVCAFPRHIQHPKPLLGCTADPTRAPYLLTSSPGLCAPAPSTPSSQIPAFPSQDWEVFLRTCPSPRFLSLTACSSLRNDHRGLSTSQQLLEANGAARAPAPALLLPWDGARRRGEQLGRGGLSSRFSLSPPQGKASD